MTTELSGRRKQKRQNIRDIVNKNVCDTSSLGGQFCYRSAASDFYDPLISGQTVLWSINFWTIVFVFRYLLDNKLSEQIITR